MLLSLFSPLMKQSCRRDYDHYTIAAIPEMMLGGGYGCSGFTSTGYGLNYAPVIIILPPVQRLSLPLVKREFFRPFRFFSTPLLVCLRIMVWSFFSVSLIDIPESFFDSSYNPAGSTSYVPRKLFKFFSLACLLSHAQTSSHLGYP